MTPDKRYWRKVESDPNHHYSGCVGKVQYPSKGKAAAAREAQMRKAIDEDEYRDKQALETYRCKCCKHWHNGHPSATIVRYRELAFRDELLLRRFVEAR